MKPKKRGKIIYKLQQATRVSSKVLNTLSDEQLFYINFNLNTSTVLEACPGGGKTEVIGLKTALNLKRDPDLGLAILTFTRSATKTLKQRIQKYNRNSGLNFPNYVGTFDSWLHNYILQPFAHSYIGYSGNGEDKSIHIIDIESTAPFLNSFSIKLYRNSVPKPIFANEYYINSNGNPESLDKVIQPILNNINQTEKDALIALKRKFFKAGFVTYTDAEYLCQRILTNKTSTRKHLAKRFPILIIDECQDLSPSQLKILSLLKNEGTKIHLIGDLNQSIYEFRKVDPQLITSFIQQENLNKLKLTNNYRSCQAIVEVSRNLIENPQPISGIEQPLDDSPASLIWEYSNQDLPHLLSKFKNFIESKNLPITNCAILARGTTLLKELRPQELNKKSVTELIANSLNLWNIPHKGAREMQNAINQMGKALCLLGYNGQGKPQSHYCPNNIETIIWRITISELLNNLSSLFPFTENGNELNWSQWTSKLRVSFEQYWGKLPIGKAEWNDSKTKIRAPQGKGNELVSETMAIRQSESQIRCATIHSVKGETLDAVLLVSSKDGRSHGGHYRQWFTTDPANEEHKRFAYVACSRPRYFLIIAVPNNSDNTQLLKCGFVEENT